ncbi:MAG TPA: phage tail tape measure protein, partial [Caldilineaceae bacterium]|nr:phage tail tape measure protein [Caldilineaceae bacterium]
SIGTQAAAADMAASLNLPIEAAEEFAEVARQVYGNNFTDSVQQAGGAVAEVAKQLQLAANDPALGTLTEKALMLSDSFSVDVSESVNAARSLAKDFGISYDEAFDFIAGGFQRGLDSSGDFLDTITEYSTQFANGGADAGQFFSLMESGLAGGMLGTDKAADAFKEFRLRILDGSKESSAALGLLGLDAEDMAARLTDGSMSVADAFQTVIGRMAETEDPTIRMQAGFGLLGSQFEDLGDSAVAALSLTKTSLEDLAGSTDGLGAKYETFGQRAEAIWRRLTVSISPLTDELLAAADDALPHLETAITQLTPVIIDLAGNVGPLVTQVAGWVSGFSELSPWVQKLILGGGALLTALVPILAILGPVAAGFSAVVGAVSAVAPIVSAAGGAIALLSNPIGWIIAAIAGLTLAWTNNWFGIRDKTAQATGWITDKLSGWMDGGERLWERYGGAVLRLVSNAGDAVKTYFQTLFGYFSEIFQAGLSILRGDWSGAMEHLGSAGQIAMDGLRGLFQIGIDSVLAVLRAFNFFGLGQEKFGEIVNAVRSIPWGDVGMGVVQGVASGIRNGAGAIVDAARSAAQSALDAAKSWL